MKTNEILSLVCSLFNSLEFFYSISYLCGFYFYRGFFCCLFVFVLFGISPALSCVFPSTTPFLNRMKLTFLGQSDGMMPWNFSKWDGAKKDFTLLAFAAGSVLVHFSLCSAT